jgi:hypothetical protein
MTTAAFGAYINAHYGPGGSIYLANGTLAGDRSVDGNSKFLHFNTLSNFTVRTSADIDLDPGGEVAIGISKSISFDAPIDTNVTIAYPRSEPRTNIQFASPGGGANPTNIRLTAFTDILLQPVGGNTIIGKNLAYYTGTGNDIADIDAGVDKTLVTKEWVNTSNGGIYGGSGSLIGSTIVTTGANDLTFTTTTGDILFNNNVGPNPTLLIDGATNTIGMGGNATLTEQLSIYNTTGSGNTTALGIYGNNTTGDQRATYINTTGAATNNTALQVNASGAATGNYALLVESGNVGIGVLTPTETVEVGTIGNVATLKFVDGNQAAGHVLTSDANGVATWTAPQVQTYQINGLAVKVGNSVNAASNPRQVMFACSMAGINNQGPCMIVNEDFTVTKVQIKWIGRTAPTIPPDALGQTADVNWILGKLTDPALTSDTNNALINFTSVLTLPNLQCSVLDTGTFIYKDSGPISASYQRDDILVLYYSAPTAGAMDWTSAIIDMTVAMTIEY